MIGSFGGCFFFNYIFFHNFQQTNILMKHKSDKEKCKKNVSNILTTGGI